MILDSSMLAKLWNMGDKVKNIRKLRSKYYDKVIEVNVPVRFYWNKGGSEEFYDGFEVGPLDGCSKYQKRLLRSVINQLAYEHDCANIAEYMRYSHKEEWRGILDRIEKEASNVPKAFLDAFKEDDRSISGLDK